jgi:hypothetical protein
MPAEESASPTRSPSDKEPREQKDVLRIIADVERSLGALRARADADKTTSDEQRALLEQVERLKAECAKLGEEKTQIREKAIRLETKLAAALGIKTDALIAAHGWQWVSRDGHQLQASRKKPGFFTAAVPMMT